MEQDKCKPRPRLLIVGPLPPPFAGPEIATQTLLESGVRDRFRVDHLDTTARASNADKGRLGPALVAAYARFCAGLVARLLRRPDYVLYLCVSTTITGWVRDATFMVLSKLVFGRTVVLKFGGGHFRSGFERAPGPVRAILRRLLGRADLMLVEAERLRSEFAGLLPDERIAVLPNAVDTAAFRAVERRPSEDLRVLFIGHLSRAKGYCDLLRAVPEVARRCPRARFFFMGAPLYRERNIFTDQTSGRRLEPEDPERVYRQYIVRTGLADRVALMGGEVRGREKLRTLRDSDLFVLPSYSEGFSMALLEAIAAATAVVTTPVGAAPEIVRDGWNGFLVAPGDMAALAARITRLLDDDELRERMGSRNMRLAREKYDITHLADRIEGLLARAGGEAAPARVEEKA